VGGDVAAGVEIHVDPDLLDRAGCLRGVRRL